MTVDRTDPQPCARLHPDWQPATDYRQPDRVDRTWEVIDGHRLLTRRVEHDPPSLGESTIFPPGAVLRYIGSSFRHGYPPFDFGHHVFQVLDPGPGFSTDEAIDPRLRPALRVGDCYEVETWDDGEDSHFWSSAVAVRSPP
jgi:hypothetical protein